MADSYFEAGDECLAATWYERARIHAISSGDDAAVSALLYNRAAMHIFHIRMERVQGRVVDVSSGRLAIDAASAENYIKYVNERSLAWVLTQLIGQVHMLAGEFELARAIFRDEHMLAQVRKWPSALLVWRADLLLCDRMCGDLSLLSLDAQVDEILRTLQSDCGNTDRIIVSSALLEACRDLDPSLEARCAEYLNEALEKWKPEKEILRKVLSGLNERLIGLTSTPPHH